MQLYVHTASADGQISAAIFGCVDSLSIVCPPYVIPITYSNLIPLKLLRKMHNYTVVLCTGIQQKQLLDFDFERKYKTFVLLCIRD